MKSKSSKMRGKNLQNLRGDTTKVTDGTFMERRDEGDVNGETLLNKFLFKTNYFVTS